MSKSYPDFWCPGCGSPNTTCRVFDGKSEFVMCGDCGKGSEKVFKPLISPFARVEKFTKDRIGGQNYAVYLFNGELLRIFDSGLFRKDNADATAKVLNEAFHARCAPLVEALEVIWPFLEEDKNLCITPGYAEAIAKVAKALEEFRK